MAKLPHQNDLPLIWITGSLTNLNGCRLPRYLRVICDEESSYTDYGFAYQSHRIMLPKECTAKRIDYFCRNETEENDYGQETFEYRDDRGI